MTPEELEQYLQYEDDRIEWKQSPKNTSGLLQAVCALANDIDDRKKPGFLLIGVDKKGAVIGVEAQGLALDNEQQMLANRLRSGKLYPIPAFDIEVVSYEQSSVLVVRVDPYPVPPIVELDGIAWVRPGSTTQRATEADRQRLRERRPLQNQPFDLRPLQGATLDDLDLRSLEASYDAAREGVDEADVFPTLESWLTQMQLGAPVANMWTPNPAAILMFGKSPQTFFPGATVELVRYAGPDFDAPVAWRKTATGTLPAQLDMLWAQLSAHIASVPGPADGIRSPFVPEYPLEALKELARNLVQHRAYVGTNAPARVEWMEDRIELSNPGGPFGRASEGAFGSFSDYRNPIITRWLKELGYVEQLGRGIRLVRKRLERNGNPALEVETDGFTRITVRRRP
jgi:ATP-dependent DNA helicase RecG